MSQHLLLADSNIFEIEKVASILKNVYEVHIANNAKDAFAIIESGMINMVFADIKMTMPDGKSLFSKIKESFPNVTRIILGGKEEDPAVLNAIQKNIAKTSILKPWDSNVLELTNKIIQTENLIKESNVFSLFVNLNELPTIRTSYQRIIQLIDNDGEINEISNVIGSDPSMTAKLLRVANSAYYGVKSSSVKQAVMYLGLRNIRELVISSSIFDVFNSSDVPERVFQPLWQQSFLSSKMVSVIYKMQGKRAPIHASTAGLLVNIGIIFLLKQFDQKYMRLIQMTKQLEQDSPYSLENFEIDEFGSTHAMIGGYLLNWWEIPYPIVEAVLYHHEPFNENVIDKDFLSIIHLAEYYSSKSIYMQSHLSKVDDCCKRLGISKIELEKKIAEL